MELRGKHRDLFIWQQAMKLAALVYTATGQLPESERYGLISQMRRSAVSVPSNISEGYYRYSRKSHISFLRIALGSCAELQTQAELAKSIYKTNMDQIINESEILMRRIQAFKKSVR